MAKIVIIGAGLAGLATAWRLHQAGLSVVVLESETQVGGRIQPAAVDNSHQDLGPTWVWPYAQPVVSRWLEELALTTFAQYDIGDALLDMHPDRQADRRSIPGQAGSCRLVGGTYALVQSLLQRLPINCVKTDCTVTDIRFEQSCFKLTLASSSTARTDDGAAIEASHVVVATPLRIAANLLQSLTSTLPTLIPHLVDTPTWMAPHAKVVIFYEKAFWRHAGLSGRIASHLGPLGEVHDHCGPEGTPAALFGFVGLPANARTAAGNKLLAAIQQQLQRCFGAEALQPIDIQIKDWAQQSQIATQADIHGDGAHPRVISDLVRQGWCEQRLWFATSETSSVSPGLIEGALDSADRVASHILNLSIP